MLNVKRLITAACLTAPLLMPVSAHAIIVTDWNFTLNNGFTDFNAGVVGSVPNTNLAGAPATKLSWGDPFNQNGENPGLQQSSLEISDQGTFSGSAVTNGAIVDTSVYTHNNFVIDGDVLVNATLLRELTLDPELPVPPATPGPGDSFSSPPLSFAIQFIETPNFWDPANPPTGNNLCPAGVPHNEFGCGDVFVLNVAGGGFDPDTFSFVQLFPFAGEIYSASVFLKNTGTGDGLVAASDEACLAAGAEIGCVAMVTAEGVVNEFQAALQINHVRTIPEPGVLALMALGLLTIGGLQRKRSA